MNIIVRKVKMNTEIFTNAGENLAVTINVEDATVGHFESQDVVVDYENLSVSDKKVVDDFVSLIKKN